uniref:Uma2 family endonuclease n=1 Tax=Petrachloros mirabilis TaxID=2918835 RepID=UPI001EE995B8|nr:Uma2 family endonuclease [Petrachloros mirabilis]
MRDSRGDASIPRIKFRDGEILLISPLPRHGREAHLLARIVEALLDSENRNYEAFTPITMDIPEAGGIEPDYCCHSGDWCCAPNPASTVDPLIFPIPHDSLHPQIST